MKPTYEYIEAEQSSPLIKKTNPDGVVWWIPCDPANSDYQAYLKRDEPEVEHLTEIPTP